MAKYPTIFIHGFFGFGEEDMMNKFMPYWGFRPDRNAMKYLTKKGYEVHYPSVGPFNSAWDRACILYAYLFGGTVDFGKVHSEKYGHARYGETYPGIMKDLGQPGPHAKINVVGHSFGGPTVLAFVDLMTNGFKEEVEGTPADELSPLFKGGMGNLIHTATTLSGVNNGTLLSDCVNGGTRIRKVAGSVFVLMTAIGDSEAVRKFWDFKFAHWGIMKDKVDVKGNTFKNPLKFKKEILRFIDNGPDDIGNEMKVVFAQPINDMRGPIGTDTYYFARRAVKSHDRGDGKHRMDKGCFPLSPIAGIATGGYFTDELREKYGVEPKTWGPNDGFVNLPGQNGPFNQPSEEATSFDGNFKKGIWYTMPVEYKDHLSWVGPFEKKKVFYKYYLDMQKLFEKLD